MGHRNIYYLINVSLMVSLSGKFSSFSDKIIISVTDMDVYRYYRIISEVGMSRY